MQALHERIQNFPYTLILGSASPRRQELLSSLGFKFERRPLNVDESEWPADLKAEQIPLYLAEMKAGGYKESIKENEILITADTIVWCEGKVFNKPVDHADGVAMLCALSGKMHEVFTAVCLKGQKKQRSFYDVSKVYFKELSGDEIDYYLTNFKPYDKAGAYGVQDWIGYIAIERIEGSFYNVMGLPVKQLYEELMRF
jgi:septum formation protein